ncbi:MAG: CotH kinase family protein [Muribaculaceae bacterium]|nr:CotH kinase family protein [Muribaculaceae bacterium]
MKSRLKILFTLLILSAVCYAEELPVLYVNFPAKALNNDEYIQGEMRLVTPDGGVIELPACFKTRGATALQYSMKPSFNMKLRDADDNELDTNLLDLREASSFILDAMAIDRICMRNRVCFDIWNAFSRLPYKSDFGSRNGTVGKFVEVYMNDEYKGIYCLSDKINRKLLDLKKPQEENGNVTIRGVLYKNGTTDIADQNTPGFYNDMMVCVARWHDAWELHEPEDYPCEEVWQPLLDYYDNNTDYSYVSAHFFEENLVDYTLFVMALSLADNWGAKNKYFSIRNIQEEGDKSKFVITPWDLDTSLGGDYNGSLYDGNYSNWAIKDIVSAANSPFSTCLPQEGFKASLKKRWQEIRKTSLSVDSVAGRMYDYCTLFTESGAWKRYIDYWDAKSSRPRYVSDLKAEVDLIVEWYRERFMQMDAYFGVDESSLSTVEVADDSFSEEYYNIQGVRVDRDKLSPGLYIVRKGDSVSKVVQR